MLDVGFVISGATRDSDEGIEVSSRFKGGAELVVFNRQPDGGSAINLFGAGSNCIAVAGRVNLRNRRLTPFPWLFSCEDQRKYRSQCLVKFA